MTPLRSSLKPKQPILAFDSEHSFSMVSMIMTFLVIEMLHHFWDYPNELDCTHLNNLYSHITQLNDVGFQTY